MHGLKIFSVLRQPIYLALAIFSAAVMIMAYAFTQVLGNVHNVDVWLATIPTLNAIMLGVFTILFGATFSFQVHIWQLPKTCSVQQKISGAGTSSLGTMGLFLVAQCPACASLGALFLPLSATVFLTQYSWLLNVLGIGLLIFTLNHLGAFAQEEHA